MHFIEGCSRYIARTPAFARSWGELWVLLIRECACRVGNAAPASAHSAGKKIPGDSLSPTRGPMKQSNRKKSSACKNLALARSVPPPSQKRSCDRLRAETPLPPSVASAAETLSVGSGEEKKTSHAVLSRGVGCTAGNPIPGTVYIIYRPVLPGTEKHLRQRLPLLQNRTELL